MEMISTKNYPNGCEESDLVCKSNDVGKAFVAIQDAFTFDFCACPWDRFGYVIMFGENIFLGENVTVS